MSFDAIPPELITAILAQASDYAPVFRAVCRCWQLLAPPKKGRPAISLGELARRNQRSLLEWALVVPTNRRANIILAAAASKGHEDLMRHAKDTWGATNFNGPLSLAAGGGHEGAMRMLHEWGATDYEWALRKAAIKGQVSAMHLVLSWNTGTSSFEVLRAAKQGGHTEAILLAKERARRAPRRRGGTSRNGSLSLKGLGISNND